MANQLLAAALWYAGRGWSVLPLHTADDNGACSCSLGKDCGRNIAKHPRTEHGHIDATTDETTIRGWWKTWPTANIGIRTGTASGLLVLDIDPRNGGDETLERYLDQFGALPLGPTVKSGGNGRHFYFSFVVGMKSTPIKGGIDIKGDGGYVVAPPSRHASGNLYSWTSPESAKRKTPTPPEWLVREQRSKARDLSMPRSKIGRGERHNFLIKRAGSYRRMGWTSDSIYQRLMDENVQWCEPPLSSDEVNKISYSADEWENPGPTATLSRELNDVGNGLRYADQHNEVLRWTSSHGPLIWTGNKWDRDELNVSQELAKQTVDAIMNEVKSDWDSEMIERRRKWQQASGSGSHIREMMKLGFSDTRIAAKFEDFDNHPMLLGVYNGVVDLHSGKLEPHHRDNNLTKLAPVWYEPDAKCPTFLSHINLITKGNKEMADYLQRLLGYCLTGDVGEGVFPIFLGSGQNGKSTLLRAIRNTLGTDYVCTAPPGFLMARSQESHDTEMASLAGSRLVIAAETGIGRRLNVEQMKQLTGEDRLRGRFLYHDPFEFPITFKVIYMKNHKPRITNVEIATWRRIKLIPFEAQILPHQRNPLIDEQLRSEAAGILNWLIRGCRKWQTDGMQEPPEVQQATVMYREDSDQFGEFIRENLVFGQGYKVSILRMFTAYEEWAREAGAQELGKMQLGKVLRERDEFKDVDVFAGNSGKMWRNVALKLDLDARKALRR